MNYVRFGDRKGRASIFQIDCKVVENAKISANAFKLVLKSGEISSAAKPGQFVSILVPEKTLRRPISICEINRENATVTLAYEVKGEGTKWLSCCKYDDRINVLGPVGNGFILPGGVKKVAAIGGGIGSPPLLFALQEFAKQGASCDAYLGFRNSSHIILQNEFEKTCEDVIVTTDDGSNGNKNFAINPLLERISEYDLLIACGPEAMLKAVQKNAAEHNLPAQISLEKRMACAVGICVVCACKTHNSEQEAYSRACKDGPVFNADEVIFDE